MFKILRNRKGVTLVELLAVIIILGIIAAIAVPTIGNLIERQRQNAAEAEWTNIEEAARIFAYDLDATDVFSLQDLLDDGALTSIVVLLDGDVDGPTDPVVDVTAEDIFVVGASSVVTVDTSGLDGTYLYIDSYLVYTP